MRLLLPEPVDPLDPYAFQASIERHPVGGRPWAVLNMIEAVDGAVTLGGRSGGLGGPADRTMFSALRSIADVIVAAAGTVRIEGYGPARPTPQRQDERTARGQAPVPPIAVITRSLRLDWGSRFFTEAVARPLVVTTADSDPSLRARAAEVADVIVAGEGSVDLAAASAELGARGFGVLVSEGGPSLNAAMLRAGALDEIAVATAPLVVGEVTPGFLGGGTLEGPIALGLTHLAEDDGYLFAHYEVRR